MSQIKHDEWNEHSEASREDCVLCLRERIEALQSALRERLWRDCKEELPKIGEIVIVWDEHWKTSYPAQFVGHYAGAYAFEAAVEREPEYLVTHWMPRPTAPKVEAARKLLEPKSL